MIHELQLPDFTIHVDGTAEPQGSKRNFTHPHTGKTVMVDASPKTRRWRNSVVKAIKEQTGGKRLFDGAVCVDITYALPRPKKHYRTGRYSHLLKGWAPIHHTEKPDKDKLDRAIYDALTESGIIKDDKVIVGGSSWKRWSWDREPDTEDPPRVQITVRDLGPEQILDDLPDDPDDGPDGDDGEPLPASQEQAA